jgi:hypothetical protein
MSAFSSKKMTRVFKRKSEKEKNYSSRDLLLMFKRDFAKSDANLRLKIEN